MHRTAELTGNKHCSDNLKIPMLCPGLINFETTSTRLFSGTVNCCKAIFIPLDFFVHEVAHEAPPSFQSTVTTDFVAFSAALYLQPKIIFPIGIYWK